MSRLKANILANFGNSILSAVIGLVFVPIYIHFLGMEAYGLMGVYASMQSLASLLDMGLSTTLNRELARLSAQSKCAQETRNLVRTLEVIYWGIAVLLGIAVVALSPVIAHRWLTAVRLSPATVERGVGMMGIALLFQWPFGFYSGGLLGLQRQVLLSVVNVVIQIARSGGAVLALWLVSPTIQVFFAWQVVVGLISTLLTASLLWRHLPEAPERSAFDHVLLGRVWRFAAGLSGITLTALALTQVDKILLSTLLTLEGFGYYTLAWVLAANLYRLVSPIFTAVFPRMTQLVASGDDQGLARSYHQGCQLVSIAILPAAAIASVFSRDLLRLWLRDATMAENTHVLLSLIVVGTCLNTLMYMPYGLQLAHGWTTLTLWTNIVAVIILVPLLMVWTYRFGAIGAGIAWSLLNTGYVFVSVPIMHRRVLRGEQWRWYLEDIGAPLIAVTAVVVVGRWCLAGQEGVLRTIVGLGIVSASAVAGAAIAAPYSRAYLTSRLTAGGQANGRREEYRHGSDL